MTKSKKDIDYGSQEVFYRDHYQSVIFGKGLGPKAVRKTHISMEKSFKNKFFHSVLEIGGGTGEHLDFVLHDYAEYFLTDLKTPDLNLTWAGNSKIFCQQANAEELPYPDYFFDRVIVTCLLHHVEKPEKVCEEILRVLKSDGVATIFLSCDPGVMVRTLRFLSTARKANSDGFKGYDLMIARDHRNHIGSLLPILKFVFRFRKLNIKYFPFIFPSWNLNGYVIVQIE